MRATVRRMDSRQRLTQTMLKLLRTQGLRATGLNQIIAESGAPRGSIYHHFPGGKEQLAVEALHAAGELTGAKIRAAATSAKGSTGPLRAFAETYAAEMRESDFQQACPIGNAVTDAAAGSPAIRDACSDVFAAWEKTIAQSLEQAGFDKKESRDLAEFVLSSIEGALILCRARRSVEPLMRVTRRLEAMLSAAKRRQS